MTDTPETVWHGRIAPFDTRDGHGRVLALPPGAPAPGGERSAAGPLPAPLYVEIDDATQGYPKLLAGQVTATSVEGGWLCATGVIDPGTEAGRAARAMLAREGGAGVGVAIEPRKVTTGAGGEMVYEEWSLSAAMITDRSPFEGARIALADAPGDEAHRA